jgi:glycosyltransferase involved in cell wall biosynthesis
MSVNRPIVLLASSVDIGGLERLLVELQQGAPPSVPVHLLLLRSGGDYERTLGHADTETFALDRPSPAALAALRRRIGELRPALIHSFGLRADLVSRWVGAPRAVRLGAVAAPFLPHARRRQLAAHLPWRRPVSYWADCRARARDGVRLHGLAERQVHVIYPGVDTHPVRPERQARELRQRLGLNEQAPLLVAVGNIRRVKGHDLLVDAMHSVRREFPDARVAIVGKDLESGALHRQIERARLTEVIHLAGHVDDPTAWLAAADLVVQPSRSEGLPRVPLEAMALRRPVLATRVGGIPELIDEGCGWLVQPDNHEALARGVRDALGSLAERQRRAWAGQQRVRAGFSREAMITGFTRLWRATASAPLRIDRSARATTEWTPRPPAQPTGTSPW